MLTKISRWLLVLSGLALIFITRSTVFNVHDQKASPGNERPAYASAPTNLSYFLPLIMKYFPVTTIFGAEMNQISSAGGLDQMVAANAAWTRRNALIWSDVEPTQGARNWSASSVASLEQELINAAARGIKVILIVRSTPTWAQNLPGSFCGPVSTNSMAAFGSFMRDLVARYSISPFNVKYWEIWNEPDVDSSLVAANSEFGCWGDQNDAYYGGGNFAGALKAVYPQVKAADSQSQVLIGGLLLDCDPRFVCKTGSASLPPKFFEGILRNGGGPYFDGVSFHAYDNYDGSLGQYDNPNWQSSWNTTGPGFIAKASFIQSVLNMYSVSGKYLINTESAIRCDVCANDATFELTKAYYITQTYSAALTQGFRANLWYSLLGWRNSGLLNSDLSIRPGYTALQFARNELLDSATAGQITNSDVGTTGITGYKFNRGDRRIWVLWSLDGNTHTVTPNLGTPLRIWDALGNPVTSASSFTVDMKPLYLEWNP